MYTSKAEDDLEVLEIINKAAIWTHSALETTQNTGITVIIYF